ncbi:hypothetical protein HDU98_011687 [Podochytrium sp. JEL0797]|nr:hypothetical protein HDU98_011687 [Podochytrium sp. JEL0797]
MLSLLRLSLFALSAAAATVQRPVVLWHGMGDSARNADSMGYIADLIRTELPDIFVHLIELGSTEEEDKNAGFFGIVTEQINQVCEDLKAIPELRHGFNAVGFSQGGQFLRGYAEMCGDGPKIHNLVTFGSQHMGNRVVIYLNFWFCGSLNVSFRNRRRPKLRGPIGRELLADEKSHQEWCISAVGAEPLSAGSVLQGKDRETRFSDTQLIEFVKDPQNYETYLEKSLFLPYINNEKEDARNDEYRKNLMELNKLVLIRFSEDQMVVPNESSVRDLFLFSKHLN